MAKTCNAYFCNSCDKYCFMIRLLMIYGGIYIGQFMTFLESGLKSLQTNSKTYGWYFKKVIPWINTWCNGID